LNIAADKLDGAVRALKPLPVHLAHAQACWGGAVPGLAALLTQPDTTLLHPSMQQEFARLRMQFGDISQDKLIKAIAAGAQQRLADLLRGIEHYLGHKYVPERTPGTVIWQCGTSRLLDYGSSHHGAPYVLMIPSLINPYTVLDLMPGRSLVAEVRSRGFRPVVLDWQDPGTEEATFDLADYITKRLIPALQHLYSQAGYPVHVFGYCMGGSLATAAAVLAGDQVASLTLLATPWDFHTDGGPVGQHSVFVRDGGGSLTTAETNLPLSGDMVQMLFVSRDTAQNDRKFRRFADVPSDSDEARFFVALETWANGCNALSRPTAHASINDWYRANKPAAGTWQIAGKPINAAQLKTPTLVIAPARDQLVPPASSEQLAKQITASGGYAEFDSPNAGHVGVLVGRARETHLWPRLVNWWRR